MLAILISEFLTRFYLLRCHSFYSDKNLNKSDKTLKKIQLSILYKRRLLSPMLLISHYIFPLAFIQFNTFPGKYHGERYKSIPSFSRLWVKYKIDVWKNLCHSHGILNAIFTIKKIFIQSKIYFIFRVDNRSIKSSTEKRSFMHLLTPLIAQGNAYLNSMKRARAELY